MRHQSSPGASAKWEENTIKCQGQLSYECINPNELVSGLLAAKRKELRKVAATHLELHRKAESLLPTLTCKTLIHAADSTLGH